MRYALIGLIALSTGRAWAQPEPATGDKPPEPVEAKPAEAKPEPASPEPNPPVKPEPPRNKPADDAPRFGAAPDDPVQPPPKIHYSTDSGFRFGSYGRVVAGTDLRGGKPEKILVVAHGPRIVEPSYLELDLSYGFETARGVKLRPVFTLAFDGTLFHDTGEFDAHPAIRNMYLDATIAPKVTAWVGSRMYRGDDIYLFDYWPLDDQNTVGGGLMYNSREGASSKRGHGLEVAGHVGWNRLNVPFQFQQIDVPNPEQGATTVIQLDRQRMVASASASYLILRDPMDVSAKIKVHAEIHSLPSGTFKRTDGTFEALPADSGMLIGAELNLFGWQVAGYRRHLNLFARYAKGLAAFDELAPPTSFGSDLTTQHANELSFGASGNWDFALGNMMIGALSRRFIDASGNDINPNNGWEYAVDARPLARLAPDWFAGADVSYQARFPRGLNPITERAEDASVFELAPMVVFSPMGPSSYDRPQIRVVYRAAHLNDGALDLYVPDDPRHGHPWVHFFGVEAEWWFNSSTYH